jgi:hypothetical protein
MSPPTSCHPDPLYMNLHDFSVFDMPLVTNDLLLNAQLPGFDFPDDITRDHLAKDYPVVYEFLNGVEKIATRYLDHDHRSIGVSDDLREAVLELLDDYRPELGLNFSLHQLLSVRCVSLVRK